MREIKFRAWDKNRKKMFPRVTQIMFGSPHNLVQVMDNFTAIENTTDVELMQFTGLKDKNGKEIYEGDIVKAEGVTMADFVDVVRYDIGNANFLYAAIPGIEVIGNIYENPELLK